MVSHRGGAFLWPENSLEAFRNTLSLAVEQAECDVHLSADGVPVVIHDATLNRTTEGDGPVAARPAADLAATRLRGAGAGVPACRCWPMWRRCSGTVRCNSRWS
ncbi:glycerophosphodiester phosphodiesterase [Teichococcus aestuarii]|uniref:glycerophosphodiester phosphodiesterase n=1 Tax=Teichococcus aestuarii TaxID=568898 RepID=UPI003623A011